MSVEQELWNIFTFYTLHGNPQDPEHLKMSQFVKLCGDCEILGKQQGGHSVSRAEINLVFQAEIRNPNRRTSRKELLTYSDFLNALMKIAPKVRGRPRPSARAAAAATAPPALLTPVTHGKARRTRARCRSAPRSRRARSTS
jgi:hypothetical protein